jgi:hypothetical protein
MNGKKTKEIEEGILQEMIYQACFFWARGTWPAAVGQQ